jgi:hypothetical protein
MYIFNRVRTVKPGHIAEAREWVVKVAALAEQTGGLPASAWSASFGPNNSSVSVSARAESQAQLASTLASIHASNAYRDLVAESVSFAAGPPEDMLCRILASNLTPNQTLQIVGVTTACCAHGQLAAATAWGAQMHEYYTGLTGGQGTFATATYGDFGRLVWIAGFDNWEAVDESADKVAVDPGYLERIDQAGSLFRPGTVSTAMAERLS